jgi:hypothetical protein
MLVLISFNILLDSGQWLLAKHLGFLDVLFSNISLWGCGFYIFALALSIILKPHKYYLFYVEGRPPYLMTLLYQKCIRKK